MLFCQPKRRHNLDDIKLQVHYYYDVRPCVEMEQLTSMLAVIKNGYIPIKDEVFWRMETISFSEGICKLLQCRITRYRFFLYKRKPTKIHFCWGTPQK